MEQVAIPIDLLKRFTPTPFEVTFELSGATIHLATNSDVMRDQLRMLQPSAKRESQGNGTLFWRIVVEPEREAYDESPSVHRLSHGGLALVRNEMMFNQCFLPALISLLNESREASL